MTGQARAAPRAQAPIIRAMPRHTARPETAADGRARRVRMTESAHKARRARTDDASAHIHRPISPVRKTAFHIRPRVFPARARYRTAARSEKTGAAHHPARVHPARAEKTAAAERLAAQAAEARTETVRKTASRVAQIRTALAAPPQKIPMRLEIFCFLRCFCARSLRAS